MGYGLENVAAGIDCTVMRQPIGVCAAIAPFNFPAMVPLWFLPFAVVCGNTFVLKPSEQVPLSQQRIFELLEQCDLPPGVVNLVNGGTEVAEAICDHPGIRAVSFVGSTPIARHVYQRATHAGKRVQALGGAKNFIVVMPDADLDRAIPTITESFYGCAGERCLAGSVLAAGRACACRRARSAGRGGARRCTSATAWTRACDMGPVISARHRDRVLGYVETAACTRARSSSLDGRAAHAAGRRVLRRPVRVRRGRRRRWRSVAKRFSGRSRLCAPVQDLDEAFRIMDAHPNANATSIFTTERQGGARVRASRHGVDGRRQHRRRRADGVFPVRRRARQLLRRPQGARPRRVRVLHGQESHDQRWF